MTLKTFKSVSLIFASVTVVICLPLLIIMVFGMPGIDDGSDWVKGFKLGFNTIGMYFFGGIILLIVYSIGNFISRKFGVTENIGTFILGMFWLFFGFSVFNLFRALRLLDFI